MTRGADDEENFFQYIIYMYIQILIIIENDDIRTGDAANHFPCSLRYVKCLVTRTLLHDRKIYLR